MVQDYSRRYVLPIKFELMVDTEDDDMKDANTEDADD